MITTLSEQEEVNDAYFRVIMQGVSQAAAEAHYKVKTVYRLQEAPVMNDLPKYAGLVLVGSIEDQVIEKLRSQNEHLVLVDNQISDLIANRVSPNLADMFEDTLGALLDQGLREIGFIGGRLRSIGLNGKQIHEHADIREKLFKIDMAAAKSRTAHCEIGEWTPLFGFEATKRLVTAYPGMNAIIAASDPIAMGILRCLHELNVSVPQKSRSSVLMTWILRSI
nr:substrate-binding domain-containing protein [Lentilactobacillus kisonensis]